MMTARKGCFDVSFELGQSGADENLFGDKLNHEDVLRELSNDMATIQAFSLRLLKLRVQRAKEEKCLRTGHLAGVLSLCRQVTARIMFEWIAENSLQMNLQITLLAFQCALSDKITMAKVSGAISVALSIFMSLFHLFSSYHFFALTALVSELQEDSIDPHSSERERAELGKLQGSIRRYVLFAHACRIGFVIALLYALCKVVAIFRCSDSLWNLTGCVHLTSVDA
jgi:hypothetical protein